MMLRYALNGDGSMISFSIAVVAVSYFAHVMYRCSISLASRVGLTIRTCMCQAVLLRALLNEGTIADARPLYASLPLLAADSDAFAECLTSGVHAIVAPATAATATALMWATLHVPGLTAALVTIGLVAAAQRVHSRSASTWPALMTCAAPMAAASGFAVALSGGSALAPGDMIATLWVLDILRASLASMPRAASSITRLAAAASRLSIALEAPQAKAKPPARTLPPALLPHLRKPGSLIVVCGPPSSGKSTLCLAALHEAMAFQRSSAAGSPPRAGYTGPHPYVMPHSPLRDNILFGALFDARRYAHICEVTGVRAAVFDPRASFGGDLSRPCDGPPLNHQQRVLLCLARCAYAQPAVAALDCRLGSLGAIALNGIYARAIQSGPLASATRIVVVDAGALHLLADADCVVLLGRGGVLIRCGPLADITAGGSGASHISPLAALLAAGGTTRPHDDILASVACASLVTSPAGKPPPSLRSRGLRRSDTWTGGGNSTHGDGDDDVEKGLEQAAPASPPLSARTAWRGTQEDDADAAGNHPSRMEPGCRASTRSALACALLCCSHAAVTGSSWWLARTIDAGTALHQRWHAALGILGGGAAIGALLMLAGLHAAQGSSSPVLVLAVCVAITSTGLLAVACPAAAVLGPLAALTIWPLLCNAAWSPKPHIRLCIKQAAAARRGAQLLIHDMATPGAAAAVALHGAASPVFGAELARLLDAGAASERRILASATRAGAAADLLAAGVLAAALFVPGTGIARGWQHSQGQSDAAIIGWGVLHARWFGAALQSGAVAWCRGMRRDSPT